MPTKETVSLYDTILKSPELNAEVKLHSRVNGRLALYLVMSLEHSMTSDDPKYPLSRVLSEEDKTAMGGSGRAKGTRKGWVRQFGSNSIGGRGLADLRSRRYAENPANL